MNGRGGSGYGHIAGFCSGSAMLTVCKSLLLYSARRFVMNDSLTSFSLHKTYAAARLMAHLLSLLETTSVHCCTVSTGCELLNACHLGWQCSPTAVDMIV